MFSVLFWGVFGLLALQFAANFVAALTSSDRDDAFLPRVYAAVRWLTTANGRAGAAAGRFARARWYAWRARREG